LRERERERERETYHNYESTEGNYVNYRYIPKVEGVIFFVHRYTFAFTESSELIYETNKKGNGVI
jgi:hypothetical protein